jgi:hypothetical protein
MKDKTGISTTLENESLDILIDSVEDVGEIVATNFELILDALKRVREARIAEAFPELDFCPDDDLGCPTFEPTITNRTPLDLVEVESSELDRYEKALAMLDSKIEDIIESDTLLRHSSCVDGLKAARRLFSGCAKKEGE